MTLGAPNIINTLPPKLKKMGSSKKNLPKNSFYIPEYTIVYPSLANIHKNKHTFGVNPTLKLTLLHDSGFKKGSFPFTYLGVPNTTKKLMSSSKCRSVELINNPTRSGSNHRKINYINYKQQQQQPC